MGRLSVQRFDRLGGTKIKTLEGKEIGQLEDVVLGPNGEALYGIVSFNKIDGMGDKWYLMPWTAVQYRGADGVGVAQDGTIIIAVAEERLKNAPGFDRHNWPLKKSDGTSGAATAKTEWPFGDVDRYYETEMRGRPIPASARLSTAGILRASELRGRAIESSTGEKLGSISEVVVDPTNGRVNYVVITTAGMGAGDRLIAVPFEALRAGKPSADAARGEVALVLPLTKDRLATAPEFFRGDSRWQEMSDPMYVTRVYEFYSVRPYWTTQPSDVNRGDARPPTPPDKKDDTQKKKDEPPKQG
jgi:sporulation protein YlmC with PRC-barrel domain